MKNFSFDTRLTACQNYIILRFSDRDTFNRISAEMVGNPRLHEVQEEPMVILLEMPATQQRYWVFGGNDIYERGDFARDLQFCTDNLEEAYSELSSEWNFILDTFAGVVYIESESSQADIIHKQYNDAGFVICEIIRK